MTSESKTASSTSKTASSTSRHVEEEEGITHFAPFEPHKSFKPSPFLKSSSELLADQEDAVSSRSNEPKVEFQHSEPLLSGNPRVIFRKLKSAVSSSSTTSSVNSSTATPEQEEVQGSSSSASASSSSAVPPPPDRPQDLQGRGTRAEGESYVEVEMAVDVLAGNGSAAALSSQNSSDLNKMAGSGPYSSAGGEVIRGVRINIEPSIGDDPMISLVSYSDAHTHLLRQQQHQRQLQQQQLSQHGGGVATRTSAMVPASLLQGHKTEMLKRFGSIADNKAQVNLSCIALAVCDGVTKMCYC